MTELSVVVLAFHQCIDVLRRTLPSSKNALSKCKFFVATSSEDKEIVAMCTALGLTPIQFGDEIIKKDGAEFNYAGIARSCMTFVKNEIKKDHWILITRPQVLLDARLTEIDLKTLATDSLYGCGMKEILTIEELAKYKPTEPSSLEVRDLVPTSSFLLSFSAPPQFDAWSKDTHSAVQRFSACFVAKYMIHLNLAYLGVKRKDDDSRQSKGNWGHLKKDKLRIEPVHAFAAKQEEESLAAEQQASTIQQATLQAKQNPDQDASIAPKPKEKIVSEKNNSKSDLPEPTLPTKKSKLFGLISGSDEEEFRPRVRTELDAQQNVASPPFPVAESEIVQPKYVKTNIWAAKIIED